MASHKYGDDYVMNFTSSGEDSDFEHEEFVPPPKPKEVTKKTGVERQPTRRPDPNVSNRNALLARENRRRKKEHLENLEDQVGKLQFENGSLRKTIKQQAKMIKKLQKEKMYYKNLLQSQPQIVNVLERFNKNFRSAEHGLFTSEGSSLSPVSSSSLSPSSEGSSSPFSIDFNENGTVLSNNIEQDLLLLPVPDIINRLLSDSETVDYMSHDPTDYSLLGINSPFHTVATPDLYSSTDCLSSISEEHNYTTHSPDSGICLHIAGDKVSVEFCSVCCENAKTVEGII